jgi:hypothetical protein
VFLGSFLSSLATFPLFEGDSVANHISLSHERKLQRDLQNIEREDWEGLEAYAGEACSAAVHSTDNKSTRSLLKKHEKVDVTSAIPFFTELIMGTKSFKLA